MLVLVQLSKFLDYVISKMKRGMGSRGGAFRRLVLMLHTCTDYIEYAVVRTRTEWKVIAEELLSDPFDFNELRAFVKRLSVPARKCIVSMTMDIGTKNILPLYALAAGFHSDLVSFVHAHMGHLQLALLELTNTEEGWCRIATMELLEANGKITHLARQAMARSCKLRNAVSIVMTDIRYIIRNTTSVRLYWVSFKDFCLAREAILWMHALVYDQEDKRSITDMWRVTSEDAELPISAFEMYRVFGPVINWFVQEHHLGDVFAILRTRKDVQLADVAGHLMLCNPQASVSYFTRYLKNLAPDTARHILVVLETKLAPDFLFDIINALITMDVVDVSMLSLCNPAVLSPDRAEFGDSHCALPPRNDARTWVLGVSVDELQIGTINIPIPVRAMLLIPEETIRAVFRIEGYHLCEMVLELCNLHKRISVQVPVKGQRQEQAFMFVLRHSRDGKKVRVDVCTTSANTYMSLGTSSVRDVDFVVSGYPTVGVPRVYTLHPPIVNVCMV